ncbi:MAG TPA: hypothetical protein VGF67_10405 [Ktedonobacteraceae bacterium]
MWIGHYIPGCKRGKRSVHLLKTSYGSQIWVATAVPCLHRALAHRQARALRGDGAEHLIRRFASLHRMGGKCQHVQTVVQVRERPA